MQDGTKLLVGVGVLAAVGVGVYFATRSTPSGAPQLAPSNPQADAAAANLPPYAGSMVSASDKAVAFSKGALANYGSDWSSTGSPIWTRSEDVLPITLSYNGGVDATYTPGLSGSGVMQGNHFLSDAANPDYPRVVAIDRSAAAMADQGALPQHFQMLLIKPSAMAAYNARGYGNLYSIIYQP